VDAWALSGHADAYGSSEWAPIVASLVLAQSMVSLFTGLLASGVLGSAEGFGAVFKPREVARCFPPAICFLMSQAALARAYIEGLGAATAMVLGWLYMPICAFLSRWLLLRAYGWLETHALGMLLMSVLAFAELRNRKTGQKHGIYGAGHIKTAVTCSITSTILAAIGSLSSETTMKTKYTPSAAQTPFYVQKARMEIGEVLAALIICGVLNTVSVNELRDGFNSWDARIYLALALRVLQSWMAGLLAKKLSSVAKAVVQCLSLLIVYFVGDAFFFANQYEGNTDDSLVTSLLALVVALTALLYQVGRTRTSFENPAGKAQPSRTLQRASQAFTEFPNAVVRGASRLKEGLGNWSNQVDKSGNGRLERASELRDAGIHARADDSVHCNGSAIRQTLTRWTFCDDTDSLSCMADCMPLGDSVLGNAVHKKHTSRCPACPQWNQMMLMDSAWVDQVREANEQLAAWLYSRSGVLSQLLCVLFFIMSDAARTIINDWLDIGRSAFVPQSMVVVSAGVSIIIGTGVSAFTVGSAKGARGALSLWDAAHCLPVAACFSLSQTATIMAYSFKITGTVNNVLGYFYMPLSALLTRVVFGYSYSALEWLALLLIALSAVVFVLLQSLQENEGLAPVPLAAILCCLTSVFCACVGSMVAEKIMKTSQKSFFEVKVHLEIGGLVTATCMLFVIGFLDARPTAAFWRKRDVGGGRLESGLLVGWDWRTYFALTAMMVQSWMGGLVAKRLSSVVKSIAQCLSLLVIYFLGDLLLKGKDFWWPVGSMALFVALSVLVFTNAKNPPPAPGSTAEDRAAPAAAVAQSEPSQIAEKRSGSAPEVEARLSAASQLSDIEMRASSSALQHPGTGEGADRKSHLLKY